MGLCTNCNLLEDQFFISRGYVIGNLFFCTSVVAERQVNVTETRVVGNGRLLNVKGCWCRMTDVIEDQKPTAYRMVALPLLNWGEATRREEASILPLNLAKFVVRW